MPAKGMQQVRRRVTAALNDVEKRAGRAAYEAMTTGGAYSDLMTPQDTSTLLNSRFQRLDQTADGWRGTIGYTAAYAAAVHDAPGTYLGTSTPRDPANPSRGDFWNPDGEPEFLRKGMEEPDVDRAFRRVMAE